VRLQGISRLAVVTLSCGALYGLAFVNRTLSEPSKPQPEPQPQSQPQPQPQQQQQQQQQQQGQQLQGSGAAEGSNGRGVTVLEPMLMLAPFLAKDMPATLQVLEQGPRPLLASTASWFMTASMGMTGLSMSLVSRLGALSVLSGVSSGPPGAHRPTTLTRPCQRCWMLRARVLLRPLKGECPGHQGVPWEASPRLGRMPGTPGSAGGVQELGHQVEYCSAVCGSCRLYSNLWCGA